MRRTLAAATAAVLLVLLLPSEALAWGPATHMQIGVELLRSVNLFPAAVAEVLAAHPVDFLYGKLAADISMAKKYAPAGRHCHHWHVAHEILDEAGDDPQLRAGVLGYLCHLSADVLAHNSFVPRMLVLTSSTRALGHSYWEHRMDSDLGARYMALARQIVVGFDHRRVDELFRRVLSATLFSFGTNRRIFRGMIRLSDNESWQAIFDTVVDRSRWDLAPAEVDLYSRHAFEVTADFLVRGESSWAATRDPIGEGALTEAKRIRRRVLLAGGWKSGEALQTTADRHFPLPSGATGLWEARGKTSGLAAELLLGVESGRRPEEATG